MDRSIEQRHLAQCDNAIAHYRARIEIQAKLIGKLSSKGQDTSAAMRTYRAMACNLDRYREQRASIASMVDGSASGRSQLKSIVGPADGVAGQAAVQAPAYPRRAVSSAPSKSPG